MKKLVLIVAVAFGASMVACSSSDKAAENAENAADSVVVENVEAVAAVVNDTLPNDSVVADTVAAVAAEVAEAPAK